MTSALVSFRRTLLGITLTALSFAAAIDLKLHYWPNAAPVKTEAAAPHLTARALTPFCTKFLPQLDALTAATMADPRTLPENRANARAAQSEFATLCALDARLGTAEARIFLDEETARANRILQQMVKISGQ